MPPQISCFIELSFKLQKYPVLKIAPNKSAGIVRVQEGNVKESS